MKQVKLTQGKVAVVDDADFALVSQYHWRAKLRHGVWYAYGYRGTATSSDIGMHRLILAAPKGTRVDHRDRDGLNNCRENLRFASVGQNRMNAVKRMKASSAFKGVHWNTTERRWYASIRKENKRKWLGGFANEVDAARAYDRAAIEIFGEFARLNFSKENA